MRPLLTATLLLAALTPRPVAGADDPFVIDGRRVERVVLSCSLDTPPEEVPAGGMARLASGVFADLRGRDIEGIRRTRRPARDLSEPTSLEPICYVHVLDGDLHHVLAVLPGDPNPVLCAPDLEPVVALEPRRFGRLMGDAPVYRGSLDPPLPGETGVARPIEPPYVASGIMMDQRTLKRRLYSGMNVLIHDTDRVLDEEQMHARLPAGYDPKRPAGLLVWASPTPSGRIPGVFEPALDELGFVCIGVDQSGNQRDNQDKFQLMLDAVATALRRYHIDDRRIYISGMSGGGRVSSILTLCFPDVFRGAVPIVGFSTYHPVSVEGQEQQIAGYFTPLDARRAAVARLRPLALIGGPPDFNYNEMKQREASLIEEGYDRVRFFEDPEMGHVMPRPDLFTEALTWVDEPYRQMRAAETEQAVAMLDRYLEGRSDPSPRTAADRRALLEVMEAAPFSEPAWEAYGLWRADE